MIVPMLDPNGVRVTVSETRSQQLVQQGWRIVSDEPVSLTPKRRTRPRKVETE